MVKSIDIVDTGINNLKKVASSGLKAIASAFTAATPSVTAKATTMSLKMADSVHKGFAKVPTYIMTTMTLPNADLQHIGSIKPERKPNQTSINGLNP